MPCGSGGANAPTWTTYASCHLAATTMESEVDRALGLLLEAGTPFDYAAVRELAAPAPPQVPELALPRVVDLRVYDRLLAAGVR